MKRQILTGLAVAGALTLWVGSSAFASEDPAEAVLQQAETYAATASTNVTNCAETKIAALEATTPTPANVDPEAWGSAVETATEKVAGLAEKAQSSIDAALETFNETVETADENGTTLPTAGDFQTEVNAIATKACADINAVEIVPPTATPGDTETDNNSADKSDTSDKSETKSGDSKSND